MKPSTLQRTHAILAIIWLLMPVPVLILGLQGSVTLVLCFSIYANAAGHFAAWQATRVEVLMEEQEDDRQSEN